MHFTTTSWTDCPLYLVGKMVVLDIEERHSWWSDNSVIVIKQKAIFIFVIKQRAILSSFAE